MDHVTFFWVYSAVIGTILVATTWITHIACKNEKIRELKEDVEVARDRLAKIYNLADMK